MKTQRSLQFYEQSGWIIERKLRNWNGEEKRKGVWRKPTKNSSLTCGERGRLGVEYASTGNGIGRDVVVVGDVCKAVSNTVSFTYWNWAVSVFASYLPLRGKAVWPFPN